MRKPLCKKSCVLDPSMICIECDLYLNDVHNHMLTRKDNTLYNTSQQLILVQHLNLFYIYSFYYFYY